MSEYFRLVGKVKRYHINGLSIDVIVKDIRQVWGRIDVKISPLRGINEIWVNIDSLYNE